MMPKKMKSLSKPIILGILLNQPTLALTGIPEPGMVFYGRVTNNGANTALGISSLSWSISEPGSGRIAELSVGNGIELVPLNGETWFVARVPFQTIVADGFTFSDLPANTFALSQSTTSYNRSAVVVNGTAANLKSPAANNVAIPDLGSATQSHSKLERVDLELGGSYQSLYDSWIVIYYPLSDPKSALTADPDKDGITNLMERALGLDPSVSSVVPVSSGTSIVNGQKYFTYTYRESINAADAPIIPEISSDLSAWASGPSTLVIVESIVEGSSRRVTVRDINPMTPNRKIFIRLKTTALRP